MKRLLKTTIKTIAPALAVAALLSSAAYAGPATSLRQHDTLGTSKRECRTAFCSGAIANLNTASPAATAMEAIQSPAAEGFAGHESHSGESQRQGNGDRQSAHSNGGGTAGNAGRGNTGPGTGNTGGPGNTGGTGNAGARATPATLVAPAALAPAQRPNTPSAKSKSNNGNHYGNDMPDNNPNDSKNKHDGENSKSDHHDKNGNEK